MKYILCFVVFLLSVFTVIAEDIQNTVKVMSFNIRMDNKGDGDNQWTNRKDFACRLVHFYQPDLIGTQEVLHHQLMDMKQRLPDYGVAGVGREDGKEKGEYSAVFYKKGRFELLENNTFWLSEQPEAVGKKGWDAACERVVTWAKLRDKLSGQVFYFFNTHFDHMGQVARHESALLLKGRVAEISGKYPVIVTGDFNAEPDSEVVQLLTDLSDSKHFADSRRMAGFRYGPEYSFHDYGRLPIAERKMIDYVFTRNIKKVLISAILTDTEGVLFVSDHYPLLVSLIL